MTDLFAVGATLCWGLVAGVWLVAWVWPVAAREHAQDARSRPGLGPGAWSLLLGVAVLVFAAGVLGVEAGTGLVVEVSWVEVIGLGTLVAATAFTVWARLSLGAMWSVRPSIGAERKLCITGPYAVTRHPIYTGILGMLLGTALLSGDAQAILAVPIMAVLVEAKIRREEQLLVAAFPDEYPAYRRSVPQLVPGLRTIRRDVETRG